MLLMNGSAARMPTQTTPTNATLKHPTSAVTVRSVGSPRRRSTHTLMARTAATTAATTATAPKTTGPQCETVSLMVRTLTTTGPLRLAPAGTY